jgi:hypothetical protein
MYDMDNKEMKLGDSLVDAHSINTASDISDIADFHRGKVLLINARGVGLIRLPAPSRELEIAVTDTDGHVVYTSTRAKACSGDAVLSDDTGDVVATKYFWGPGKDPVMHRLPTSAEKHADEALKPDDGEEIKTKSKWTSRSHVFTLPDGKQFEWRYAKQPANERNQKARLLVLCEKLDKTEKRQGRKVAQLVRSDDTRTPGSTKNAAGNGGELTLVDGCNDILDESIVVATCLLMLKKEIDRRRALQAAVLISATGA